MTREMDKVSIIIPVYNSEKYISRCVQSVFSQTYNNIEIVIVNDGSSDGSDRIIVELLKDTSNSIYVKLEENAGLSNARNVGLCNATGERIIFLDSDDTIEPDTISKLMNQESDELVLCGFYRKKDSEISHEKTSIYNGLYEKKDFLSRLFVDYTLSWFSCVGTKLYNARIIRNNNVRFTDEYKYNEDLGFIVDYLRNIDSVSVVNEDLYCYYFTPDSIQHKKSFRVGSLETITNSRENLKAILVEENLWDEKVVKFNQTVSEVYFYSLLANWDGYYDFMKSYYFVKSNQRYLQQWKKFDNHMLKIFSLFTIKSFDRLCYIYIKLLTDAMYLKNHIMRK